MSESEDKGPIDLKAWFKQPQPTHLPDGSSVPFDVLTAQAVPKEPVTLESPLSNAQRPTELSPIQPDSIKLASPTESIPSENSIEIFVVPPNLTVYINNLMSSGKKLGFLRYSLGRCQSVDEAKEDLKKAYNHYELSDEEYAEALRLLEGRTDDTTTAIEERMDQPVAKTESLTEPPLENSQENFTVPVGLMAFIEGVALGGTDMSSVIDLLKRAKSKRDVARYLGSANFHEILNDSQYERAMRLLGELEEDNQETIIYDTELESLAMGAIRAGEIDKAVEYVKRMSSSDSRSQEAEIIAIGLVDTGDIERAKIFARLIEDMDIRKRMINYIIAKGNKSETTKPAPAEETPIDVLTDKPEETPVEKGKDTVVEVGDVDGADKTKSPEEIELENARSEYATQLIAWKNKNREKKRWYSKIISDLGMEKQMPESEKPQELRDAENAYIQAKKKKTQLVINDGRFLEGAKETGEKGYFFTADIINQAETEYGILQQQILDSIPTVERGRISKAMEKWAKFPLPARIALTTTLMVGAGMAFGTVAVGGALGTIAYRGARSLTGAVFGQEAGAIAGQEMESRSEKRIREAKEAYGREMQIDLSNFEELERERGRFLEREENQIKRNRLKKAGVMMAVGAGVNIGGDLWAKGILGTVPGTISRPRIGVLNDVPRARVTTPTRGIEDLPVKPKIPLSEPNSPSGSLIDKLTERPRVTISEVSEMKAPVVSEASLESQVELSSKGFLQDIHNLKAQIIRDYGGDMDNVPSEVKANFINKPTIQLAKEYGFYKPGETADSAMGYKGDLLSVDSHGHLVYEHGGKADTMFDESTQHVKTYTEVGGKKMFTPEPEMVKVKAEFVDKNLHDTDTDVSTVKPKITTEVTPAPEDSISVPNQDFIPGETLPPETIVEPSVIHIPYKDSFVDVSVVDDVKTMMFNGQKIATADYYQVSGEGLTDLDRQLYALRDQFQDGAQYRDIREAFNTAFNQTPFSPKIGQKFLESIDFEGGKIYIAQGIGDNPNAVTVLLNGKAIASGVVEQGGPKVNLFNDPGIKSGWLFSDTVYERAFKEAKKVIKSLKMSK